MAVLNAWFLEIWSHIPLECKSGTAYEFQFGQKDVGLCLMNANMKLLNTKPKNQLITSTRYISWIYDLMH